MKRDMDLIRQILFLLEEKQDSFADTITIPGYVISDN